MIELSMHDVGTIKVRSVFPDNGMSMQLVFGDQLELVLYGVSSTKVAGLIKLLGVTDDFRYAFLGGRPILYGDEAVQAFLEKYS